MTTPLLAATAAVILIGGIWLVISGLTPTPTPVGPPRRKAVRSYGRLLGTDRRSRRLRALGAIGFVIGLFLAALTPWWIAIVIVPAAFVGIPLLLQPSAGKNQISRIEAMEEWTRSLAGVLGAGVGLEQAMQATLSRSTPDAIWPEVQLLVARLRARWDTRAALRQFADDLNDPTGDAIVAGLLLAAERRGQGLAKMLEGIAERAAEDVRNRRRIEADLAKPRSTARWVTIITIGVLGLMILNGSYIEPYSRGLIGPLILVSLLSAYAAALLWMRRMSKGEELPRFLGDSRAVPGTGKG